MKRPLLALASLAFAPLLLEGCSSKTPVPDVPLDVAVTVTSPTPDRKGARNPITFDTSQDCNDPKSLITCFTVDLRVRNNDSVGSTRTSFTGTAAWLRLSLTAGTIVEARTTSGGPDVAGTNVHLTSGEAKGIVIKVIGAFGDTRVVAQNVGFVPAPPGKAPACSNGTDDDNDGYADYPNDPDCYFLNDDSEAPYDPVYGVSTPLSYEFPRILDVQGGNASASPFVARQVDIVGRDPVKMIVTAVTNDGMYVTDTTETRPGASSIFVFNFNAPYGIRACDRLLRLAGNVSEFFGFTELGTPGWTNSPWLGEARSGTCPIPDYFEVTDAMSGLVEKMNPLEASLVTVKGPVLGTHFGPAKAPAGTPGDGASNCDLNGDGIVGFNASKAGFRDDEKACNDLCSADPDCTEWNNYKQFSEVKIKFGGGDGTLFLDPGQLPKFDPLTLVGPRKFVEIRGVIRRFLGPTPPNILIPRCEDDVVWPKAPMGTAESECLGRASNGACTKAGDPCSIAVVCGKQPDGSTREGTFAMSCVNTAAGLKWQRTVVGCESSKACVRPRVGEDLEGTY